MKHAYDSEKYKIALKKRKLSAGSYSDLATKLNPIDIKQVV